MRTRAQVALVSLALSASIPVLAQNPRGPSFEVASVRLSSAPGTRSSQRMADTRVDFLNVSVLSLLLTAFGIQPYQLFAPDWVGDVRLDIQATMPAGSTRREVPEMLQRLLAERMGLVTARETRPVEGYELVVGKGGPRMREVEARNDLAAKIAPDAILSPAASERTDTVADTPDGQVRTLRRDMGTITITDRTRYHLRVNVERRTQTLTATRMTMTELAAAMAKNMSEPVVDKTGLTGIYEFTLELPLAAATVRRAAGIGVGVQSMGSESRAVQSVGLSLERRRTPIDVVVVQKIERAPTEN
jgi:uncharacterized protein (TIGR03435 family)